MDTPTNPAPSVRDGEEVGLAEWRSLDPQEIVRRTRCEATVFKYATDIMLWRECCDLILRRLGPKSVASAPVPDQSGVGGDVGGQTGACLTAPGSSPTGEAAEASSSQATAIPSRGPADLAQRIAHVLYTHNAYIEALWQPDPTAPYEGAVCWSDKYALALANGIIAKALLPYPGFAAAIPSRGWKDISSAPRDGTKFDAWAVHPACSTMGGRFPDVQMRGDDSGFGVIIHRPNAHWEYLEQDGPTYPAWRLTHWRPRPDGPASCDSDPQGEDAPGAAESRSDASAVGEAETPEVFHNSPLPDDKTAGMTVEETQS